MRKIETRTGKTIVLLNPSEKGKKYATEMKYGYAKTNDNKTKRDANGKGIPLTNEQRAYRAGYLAHSKDSANAWKANNGVKSVKKNKRK